MNDLDADGFTREESEWLDEQSALADEADERGAR